MLTTQGNRPVPVMRLEGVGGLGGGVDGMDHSDLPLLRLDFSFRINAKAMCGIYLGAPLPCEGLDSLATILPRIRLGFRVRANGLYGPINK